MNIQTVVYNGVSFVNVHDPKETEIKYLRTNYGFNSLHLDDYLNKIQVPQVETYKNYILAVLDFPYLAPQNGSHKQDAKTTSFLSYVPTLTQNTPVNVFKPNRLSTGHVNFFIGDQYLVVLHDEKTPQIDEIFSYCQKTLRNRQEFMSEGSAYLFYRIVDVLIDSTFKVLNEISSTIDYIDKKLAEGHSLPVVEAISLTRRNIVVFQTIVKQELPIYTDLEKGKPEKLGKNLMPFWSNVKDHSQKISERLDDSRELNEGIASSHESLLAVRTNEIVKVLTIFTAIMLPLTLVASMYGMNVPLPFQDNPYAFLIITEVMGIIALVMIYIFKSKDWF